MATTNRLRKTLPVTGASDDVDIDKKISFELNKMECKAITLGGITNIIAGAFVVWALYTNSQLVELIGWYVVLVLVNVLNILWALHFEYGNATPVQLQSWRKFTRVILATLALTWGSIGVLFVSGNLHYQLYTIAFLLAVLIGFSFGSVTDFVGSALCIICILFPSIFYRVYLGIHALQHIGHDRDLNLAIGVSLLILGLFLLIACYIGNRWIKKFFKLSFENVALNEKLESMNKFLEQRVKERTIKLENSLKQVTYQATHDLLTSLPNQRLLLKYIDIAIKSADKDTHTFCVVCFSLNELEKINDGLGHQAGEFVVKTIAKRLMEKFGQPQANDVNHVHYTITLSRKDVFVILIEPIVKLEEIESKVEALSRILDVPVSAGKQDIKLTASMGVSLYPRDGKNMTSLLMNADAAMLQAKKRGGNSINIYKSKINIDISKQLEIERNLHNALENNEFILQYQPFVDLKTGYICGMEALVRWNSPVLGFVAPDNFIPLAEADGIIIPLGEWVMRTACTQTKVWHDQGFTSLKVAINLSAKQLLKREIVLIISRILKETGLDPQFVELELTETAAFQEEVIPVLKKFKEMGLGLSIDDFGTGYSGLSNIKLFTIDKLKIDKSFVKDVVTSDDSKAIVSNTIALAKKINVTVLAEGVETIEQLRFLQEHGCDLIQGYYFSRPLDPDAFTKLLISNARFVDPLI